MTTVGVFLCIFFGHMIVCIRICFVSVFVFLVRVAWGAVPCLSVCQPLSVRCLQRFLFRPLKFSVSAALRKS